MSLYLTTTGTNVFISELGFQLTHPTTDFNIDSQFSADDIRGATSLTSAIQAGTLIWRKTAGGSNQAPTDYDPDYVGIVQESGGSGNKADSLPTYGDLLLTNVLTTTNTTITLTNASARRILFTGTTAGQIVKLPDATTLLVTETFEIWNLSTQTISIQDGSAAALFTLRANNIVKIVLRVNTAAAGTWDVISYVPNFSTGSIPFADGSKGLLEDNTNFVWDNTNKRLNVGNPTSPTSRLAVATSTDAAVAEFRGTTISASTLMTWQLPLTAGLTTGKTLELFAGSEANSRLILYSDGTWGWGPGTVTRDTYLYRSAANTLSLDSNKAGGFGSLAISGNLSSKTTRRQTLIQATAASTLPLIATSESQIIFTGTTASQIVVLPDATTLLVGHIYKIKNRSTQPITINQNGGTTLLVLPAQANTEITLQVNSTAAGTWDSEQTTVFGQNYQSIEDAAFTTTTATAFSNKLTLTTPATLPAGTYRLGWFYSWYYTQGSSAFNTRVQVDAASIWTQVTNPASNANATTQRNPSNGCEEVILTAGAHTITLDFAAGKNGQTAGIGSARLEFWRVA